MKSAILSSDEKQTKSEILTAARAAAEETGGKVVVEVDASDLKDKKDERPKEARISKAENGFLICWYDNSGEPWGSEKKYVAENFDDAVKHLKKYMG